MESKTAAPLGRIVSRMAPPFEFTVTTGGGGSVTVTFPKGVDAYDVAMRAFGAGQLTDDRRVIWGMGGCTITVTPDAEALVIEPMSWEISL